MHLLQSVEDHVGWTMFLWKLTDIEMHPLKVVNLLLQNSSVDRLLKGDSQIRRKAKVQSGLQADSS